MQDNRPDRLRNLDALSHDFTAASRYPAVAARDLSRLAALAKTVIDDLAGWGDRLEALDCAAPFNAARATLLVLESVFDEVLTPDASRVLEAEIALRMG